MKSLVHFSFGGYISLFTVQVNNQFMYEPQLSTKRSLIVYCENLYGQLDLWGTQVSSLYGLHNDFNIN